MSHFQSNAMVEITSSESFDTTLRRLIDTITRKGMTIFAQVDHAAGARSVGMAMQPSTLVIYGSPAGGTPLMREAPRAALDLPLRVLVRESTQGKVIVSFHPIAPLLLQAGVSEALSVRLDPAQHMFAEALS